MVRKEIEITVDKDGNVSINVINGDGPSCLKETEELERELGIVKSREKKPEFYKASTQKRIRSSLL